MQAIASHEVLVGATASETRMRVATRGHRGVACRALLHAGLLAPWYAARKFLDEGTLHRVRRGFTSFFFFFNS